MRTCTLAPSAGGPEDSAGGRCGRTPFRPSRGGRAAATAALLSLAALGCSKRSEDVEAKPLSPKALARQLAGTIEQPIDIDDPQTCATCHSAVYAEWTESMHARAHKSKDPIYGAMRQLRISKGQKIEGKCENCHAPRAQGEYESLAAKAGVSCATCHNLETVHASEIAKGAKQLVFASDDTMRSARDVEPKSSPVHGTGPAHPALADGKTLCLACHGKHTNPAKVPVCTTGTELEAHAGDDTCVTCHMPQEEGPSGPVSAQKTHRSHRFLGPHRAYLQDDPSPLERGVDMQVELHERTLKVTLRNLSGHGFPSGFPGRYAIVGLEGLDAQSEVVWRNFRGDPMKESPQSVLNKVYLGPDGKPALPPLATKLGRDSRLEPDEVRVVEYAVPEAVQEVRATLSYGLLPRPAAEALNLADDPLAKPVEVLSVTAVRDS